MSTVTQIITQIVAVLDDISDIDTTSISEFLPPVTTQKVALIVPPIGMRGHIGWATPDRDPRFQSHRIPCEFWIKVDTGNLSSCMERGREICLTAARKLIDSGNLNGTVMSVGYMLINGESDGPDLEYRVDDELITVGKSPYIRATLFVPVVDYASA